MSKQIRITAANWKQLRADQDAGFIKVVPVLNPFKRRKVKKSKR